MRVFPLFDEPFSGTLVIFLFILLYFILLLLLFFVIVLFIFNYIFCLFNWWYTPLKNQVFSLFVIFVLFTFLNFGQLVCKVCTIWNYYRISPSYYPLLKSVENVFLYEMNFDYRHCTDLKDVIPFVKSWGIRKWVKIRNFEKNVKL